MASRIAIEPNCGAETVVKLPLKGAVGVRTAERMYASWISFGGCLEEAKCRCIDWRRCCG